MFSTYSALPRLLLDPPHFPTHLTLYPLILMSFYPSGTNLCCYGNTATYLGLDRKRNPTLCLQLLSVVNTSSASSETSWPPPLSTLGLSLAWASTGNLVCACSSAKSLLCWRFLWYKEQPNFLLRASPCFSALTRSPCFWQKIIS